MSRLTTTISALATGAAAVVLSGCSAGQITQTSGQVAAVPGANQTIELKDGSDRTIGRIALRDLQVAYHAGGYTAGTPAPLLVRVFNDSASPVRLCDVVSESAEITYGAAQPSAPEPSGSASPSGTASQSPSATPAAAEEPAETPGATASPSPSAAASPSAASGSCKLGLTIPTQGYSLLLPDQPAFLQAVVAEDLVPGGGVHGVTFLFEDAKGKQWRTDPFSIPLAPPATPLPRASSDIEEEEHH